MKTLSCAGLFILLALAFTPCQAGASATIGFSLDFHDALAPYGTWVHVSACADCWRPAVPGFVPFTNGHWIYTSYGPMWEGEESWAWAPYHYGHWVYTVQYGWIWSPGYEWSPGNVAWCYGSDYIGWSPIPGAAPTNTSLWIVVHRNNFGYRNYAAVRIHRDAVQTLFARRIVRVSSGPLQRVQVERIVRHAIPVQNVHEREIEVNHHRTRLVVTPDREPAVVRRLSEASARRYSTHPSGGEKPARAAHTGPGHDLNKPAPGHSNKGAHPPKNTSAKMKPKHKPPETRE